MAHKALMMGVAAAAVVVSAGSALAGGFAIREQSATSQGASFAGNGVAGDSISAMFWNPSAVTSAEGLVTESHATIIIPKSELNVDYGRTNTDDLFGITGNGGDVGIDAFVPASYVAYQVNEDLYLGVSVNAPYGLATHSEKPWVGQFDHDRAKVFSVNVTPTVGYKINDFVSIGVGAQIQYMKVNVQSVTPVGAQELEGDDFGFGLTAGVTLTPMDGTEIGIGFRSAIDHELEGTQAIGAFPTADISAGVTLPESVNLSLRQRINEQFTLLASAEWTNWSRLGTVPITGGSGALTFEYEDGWFFAVGGEYDYNENLTLRAGLAYELSPVTDEHRSMRLPDNDRLWLSAGASYDFGNGLSLDAAYTHIFVNDAAVDQTSFGLLRYAGEAEGSVDIMSVSLRYKLGG
jgi:long-chain fatty acid transport protein